MESVFFKKAMTSSVNKEIKASAHIDTDSHLESCGVGENLELIGHH